MKNIFAFALLGCLCGGVFAQTNPAPATAPQAAAAQAPQTEPATSGVVGDRNSAYTDRIPPEQMVMLDANGDKFQARHIADLSGQPRGAVIILHDSGQHPNWPFTAAALIDDLPLHGWDTLSIELPTPDITAKAETPATVPSATSPPASAPPANNSAPAAGANSNTVAKVNVESQTQARIGAAIKYFADQKQNNIALIGFGSGAIRAAENVRLLAAGAAASNNTATPNNTTTPNNTANAAAPNNTATPSNSTSPNDTAPLTALVMIAPLQQLSGIDMNLPKLLPLTGITTLDMTLDNEPEARSDAEARRRAVLHQRKRIYTRVEMPPLDNISDAQHSAMVKRVRSWLQTNAHPPSRPAQEKAQIAAPQ